MKKKGICLLFILIIVSRYLFSQNSFEEGKIIIKIKEDSNIDLLKWMETNSDNSFSIISLKRVFEPKNQKNKYYQSLIRTYSLETNEYEINSVIDFFKQQDFIEYTERIPMIELLFTPNDSLYRSSIAGANAIWPLQKINAAMAWNYTQGSSSIKIAIIDNAIWTSHPDLDGKFVDIYDFADNDNNTDPGSFSNDATGRQWAHGTHVSGLAGAQTNNNRGIASIGFNSSLMAYKMYKNGSIPMPDLTAGCTAIQTAADRGAHVINISWGSTNNLTTLSDAVNYAYTEGAIIIAAAGNNGREEAYYPAGYQNTIAVASVGMDDKKSSFSNFGTFVDITAPGGYGPTDAGAWSVISSTSHVAHAWNSIIGNVYYDGKVGTSMAAPIVSGLCALLLSIDSTLTQNQIKTILQTTSVDISSLNTQFAGKLGTGRINAAAAVASIAGNNTKMEENIANPIAVYPNPSDGNITIVASNEIVSEVYILDLNGKILNKLNPRDYNLVSFDIPQNINNGLYFLQIHTNSNRIKTEKIILNR